MLLTANLPQARRVIDVQLQRLWAASCVREVAPIMLWGPPGVGKSQVVRELCDGLDVGFIDVRLSQMEPVDMRGIPVPDGESVKWLVASTWPRDPKSRGILLFDELTAADRALQVAAYELLLDRRLGDLYTLPEDWLIMGAGNRTDDGAISTPLSSALTNRLLHVELGADIESWSAYAMAKGLHPDVVAFLRFKPTYLLANDDNTQRGWPSPRSWERVASLLKEEREIDPMTQRLMIHGLVGHTAATEFLAFRRLAPQRVNIPAMLRGEGSVVIPERIDQQLVFIAAVVNALWQDNEGESGMVGTIEQQEAALAQRLSVFFEIGTRLESDLATLMLMDALRVAGSTGSEAESRAERLFAHPGFQTWLDLHGIDMERIMPMADLDLPEGCVSIAAAREAQSDDPSTANSVTLSALAGGRR